MTVDYAAIEAAVVAKLAGDATLAGIVVTFERGLRECLYEDSAQAINDGFRDAELPAILVQAMSDADRQTPWTTCEVSHEIPVRVFGMVKAQDTDEAGQAAMGLASEIARVLNACRRTDASLGANTWVVGEVKSSKAVFSSELYRYGAALVEVVVRKVVTI